MSLLGRLEDLSLTDIVQIVFLSRRTGVLEIIDEAGRHTVLFRQGLIVSASSPEWPDIVSYLEAGGMIAKQSTTLLRQMEESGIPFGSTIVEMTLMTPQALSDAIRARILSVVSPLLQSREGEFNFILSDQVSALDIEYDPDLLFKEGGFPPSKIIGVADGEKIKPLKGLEESLKAGKALLRSASSAETTPSSLNLGLGQPVNPPAPSRLPGTATSATGNVLAFPKAEEREEKPQFTPVPDEAPFPEPSATPSAEQPPAAAAPATRSGQFKVSGGLIEVESPDATYRNVVLLERNPLIRVAARRAFSKNGVKIAQFGSVDDVRTAIGELFRSNSFFVTFLELTDADRHDNGPSVVLMQRL